ncbi:MAG: alpha/beta hydrolase [bacterium]|nr:alpha/beta hydrolase [bacterium]
MEDQYIRTEDGAICYRVIKNKGKTIVFIHGGGSSLSSWEFIYPFFHKKGFNIILIDLRGHGKSLRSENWYDYRLEKHAQDIAKILAKEKIKKAILVGHCLGGMIGITFAFLYPDKVENLILVNPGINNKSFFFNSFTKTFVIFLYSLMRIFPLKTIYSISYRVDYKPFQRSHDFSPFRLFEDLKSTGIVSVLSQTQAFFEWQGEQYYKNINIPTLIIGGKKDVVFNIHVSEIIKKLLKNSTLKIINTSHTAVINNPKEIKNAIYHFISH